MKYIIKILVSPFLFCFIWISYTILALNNTRLFILYGGEWNTYTKDDKATMQSIYLELKKQNEEMLKNK